MDAAGASSGGVWGAAWKRLCTDRVGLVSLAIVAAFVLLIAAAAAGLVAEGWQQELGLPNALPSFIGPAPAAATSGIAQPTGPNADISAVDPLAPRYQKWAERADVAIGVGGTPAEFAKFIAIEQQRWRAVVARAKIKPD